MNPILAPKPGHVFRRHRNRLALFRPGGDLQGYWREYWSETLRTSQLDRGRAGDLNEFEDLVDKYVSRDLPVLDAGCGPGQYVAAFKARGFKAKGVDLDAEVVAFVNKASPDLDVRQGDVRALDVPTGSIGCYLALGIIEHFEGGPEPALAETRRVLHPDGVALLSAPYLNPRRAALLKGLIERPSPDDGLQFHQYYFSEGDLSALLRSAGLGVVARFPYAVEGFLRREHPFWARFWNSPLCPGPLKARLRKRWATASLPERLRHGHMLLLVCRPVLTSDREKTRRVAG